MPEKINIYKSYGEKLIALFAKLLFTGKKYSLSELAGLLSCSKQTVLRLIEDIRRTYAVEVMEATEGNRKFYWVKKPRGKTAAATLTDTELSALFMCRSFAEHLLGERLFAEVTQALEKTSTLRGGEQALSNDHFACFRPGTIDYTPHRDTLHTLMSALEQQRICRLSYQSLGAARPKTLYIKPLRIFSHHDTIYLHARLARKPGAVYQKPSFDPLLAVHRMKQVELTERSFEMPTDYNFDEVFNQEFGLIKERSFRVVVEFTGFAAAYVAERIWSPDQKIKWLDEGTMQLTFSASSEPEVKSWVLSFGEEAKLIKPKRLVKTLDATIRRMCS
jgi:predicted DNA-binding transcriptional regulator YafY